ncbi:hypothetical protein [Fodinibius sp. Rm-B-1B1-1]|uniref:hypothetical protein n=1 Tax=Fodinibius alkaliphilus TaxID=3140241 RepID=UPI003159CA8A
MKKYYLIVNTIVLGLLAAGCLTNSNSSGSDTFYGPSKQLGNGSIRTFVTLSEDGIPVSIGYSFTKGMLSALPQDIENRKNVFLEYPKEAKLTGYKYAELGWNPHGHEPEDIYGIPHFDFHFYIVGEDKVSEVVPGPDTVKVSQQYIPEDYASGQIAIPDMGVHWHDSRAPEWNGEKFRATFIYGFYHGNMYFLEPMITNAFLETRPDTTIPVKQPAAFQKTGYYPTEYSIRYNDKNNIYKVSLDGLTKHEANNNE